MVGWFSKDHSECCLAVLLIKLENKVIICPNFHNESSETELSISYTNHLVVFVNCSWPTVVEVQAFLERHPTCGSFTVPLKTFTIGANKNNGKGGESFS